MGAYVFDNSWSKERERLAGLEAGLDPATTRFLDAIGVGPGWTCLEVAGGGGSITQWLSRRVGPTGKVVATDLDTRFLDALDEPNLEVLRHDVVVDDLPEEHFDLIHARLLLEHLPDRDAALKRLVTALKPGGRILIEDLDWRGLLAREPRVYVYPETAVKQSIRAWRAAVKVMLMAGYDPEYGWRLPGELRALGLENVGAEVHMSIEEGGGPQSAAPRFSFEHMRPALLAGKLLTNREIDREIARLSDPSLLGGGLMMVSAWGRRAEGERPARAAGAMPARREGVVDRLKTAPLFAGCTTQEVDRIATLAEETQVAGGDVLTREGEEEALFYVITTGTATVTRQGHALATLGPGSFFGEMALLSKGPRTATVTANSTMTLLVLGEQAFGDLLKEAPTVARKILEGIAERLHEADQALTEP